jgi:hypothetical protein
MTQRIQLGCGLDGMAALEPGSVDMVLSDLPSGETDAGFDVKPNLARFFAVTRRALKPTGVLVAMASSFRFAVELYDHGRDWYRYDLIWHKSLPAGFLNAGTRPLRSHEFALVFFRSQGTYNPQMVETGIPISKNTTGARVKSENYGANGRIASRAGATDRFPGSVLTVGSVGNRDPKRTHPQQKPDALFSGWVLTYTNPGDLVVDPFAGSGTTARAAEANGRRFLCWDKSERFGGK